MTESIFAGQIPKRLQKKAEVLLKNHKKYHYYGWRKVVGLKKWFSYKLNDNYRILHQQGGIYFISNHDKYIKKIRAIRKQES